MKFWLHIMVASVLFAFTFFAKADDPVRLNINITGTVVANGSCTFNKGETLTVDFGDVEITTVNGSSKIDGSYQKTLSSMMTCSGDIAGSAQMTLKSVAGGTVEYQGQKLLPVSINAKNPGQELGIRLLVDGVEQDIDAAFPVDASQQPGLQVELVQIGDGSGLVGGAPITASATLIMEFV
ncbi:fimbrial protein [Enterobacter sp. PI-10]|uniref:fimbrial protein n=1 Tax=Enterobacter sp. PI-10 TaxID=2899140 RepID=UPI002300C7FC|nr:fimbrial protein [Enterobacter sp. PI-10]MDA5604289.1 fimbrial protein [Enterobacter sp. PI-10]